jgi:hypothetical protein
MFWHKSRPLRGVGEVYGSPPVLDADGEARGRAGEGGCGVTDRQDDEERESTRRREQEDDVRRQKDRERRFDELREAWRRHHPSEPEEGGEDQPRKGRPT